jgi:hypothetical protein
VARTCPLRKELSTLFVMTDKPVQTSAMVSSVRHIPGDFLLAILIKLLLLLYQFSIHVENALLVGGS